MIACEKGIGFSQDDGRTIAEGAISAAEPRPAPNRVEVARRTDPSNCLVTTLCVRSFADLFQDTERHF